VVKRTSDQQLLTRYARQRDEGAFAELVQRQVDLVYSAALRLVIDPHLAEDVTQAVFTALARQAAEVARRLDGGAPLSGWLHVTTRNQAAATVRTEERRRAREKEAVAMLEPAVPESAANWEQIAPHLDHALAELSNTDRDVLLLRFFERRTAKEIGDRLGVGEEAAQKRVARALERLRGVLVVRGLAMPSVTLGGVLTANAVQTAPLALVGTIAAGTATATTGALSILGILQLMTSTKLKIGIAALVAAGMATVVVSQQREIQRLRRELATAQELQATPQQYPASNRVTADTGHLEELLRLRGEVAKLRHQERELTALRAEYQQLKAATPAQDRSTGVSDVAVAEWAKVKIDATGAVFVNKKKMTPADFEAECGRLKEVGGAMQLYVDAPNQVLSAAQAEAVRQIVEAGVGMKMVMKESDLD
jgi:RNA polymerase sigma factor (sigma-70 family)